MFASVARNFEVTPAHVRVMQSKNYLQESGVMCLRRKRTHYLRECPRNINIRAQPNTDWAHNAFGIKLYSLGHVSICVHVELFEFRCGAIARR